MRGIRPGVLLFLVCLTFRGAPAERGADASYQQAFDALRHMEPRGDRVASVHDVTLRRDAAEFRLRQGTLSLLTPVGERTVAAVFTGDGAVSFRPPSPADRGEVHRVLGDSAFADAPFSTAVFIFADSTLAELEARVTFHSGDVPGAAAGSVHDALEYLTDGGARGVQPTLMSAVLNRVYNGFFAAFVRRQHGEHVMIVVDPEQAEGVLLLRRGHLPRERVETVCQFQRAEDRARGIAVAAAHAAAFAPAAYRIDVTITEGLGFSAWAAVRLVARRDSLRWLPFELYRELDVDSVLDDAGSAARFFRAKRSSTLWVRLNRPTRSGDTVAVRVVYHGGLLQQVSLLQAFLG